MGGGTWVVMDRVLPLTVRAGQAIFKIGKDIRLKI